MRTAFALAICAGIASCCITSHSVKSAAPSPVSPSKLDGDGGAAALGPVIIADGECVNVVDADTVDVRLSMVVRVRLLDAWAPEKFAKNGDQSEKARGLAAKARAKELIQGKSVRVEIPLQDALKDMLTLNRVLGRVRCLNDMTGAIEFDLAETMVSEGFATKER